jgi:hypothetical protein
VEVGATPLSIRVVTDGRAGIENQALGLAEAIARLTPAVIQTRRVSWRSAFDWLPADLKVPAMLDPASDAPYPRKGEPWPDLWIAAGRASLPLSLGARKRSGGRTFVVQIQDPRLDPARFDLIVVPAHDGLAGANVVSITGSPHRITSQGLVEAASEFGAVLEPLPRPRVAVLVGGRSKAFGLTPDHAAVLANRISAAVEARTGSVMLTYSRRTPNAAKAVMSERLADVPGFIWDGGGPNPLFAMLHYADHILVTEDSANMAAEAASTGKPVHILPMVALKPPGKFARLHADLRDRGAARPFDRRLETWTYEPLAETERAARAVLEAMKRG